MPWQQLHIVAARPRAETVEDAMLDSGALSVSMTDDADTPVLEPGVGETPLWDQVRITALYEDGSDTAAISAQLCAALGIVASALHWEYLADQPWERAWMDHFEPIRCGDRLWICPSWKAPPDPQGINLILDPGLAFGTGTHPTTFLCLRWLDGLDLAGKTVVDYGCGSGILGIAALLLGAEKVVAIDNDPQALIATRDNLSRNGLAESRLSACLPPETPDIQADVVVANILAGPLVSLAENITALVKDHGLLCLSGIMPHQATEVQAAYETVFRFSPATRQDDWVRLDARKK
ncbi:MAG: 50S ribosomal protein L11 methyltransferase [Porticoccaceae bacterium]